METKIDADTKMSAFLFKIYFEKTYGYDIINVMDGAPVRCIYSSWCESNLER